jgi:hypothetical protein
MTDMANSIRSVVDEAVDACASIIDIAVGENPKLSANAIRMTICDVLTASVARVVARSNHAGMPVEQIIERHANHALQMVLIAEQVEASDCNPERAN